MNPIFQLNSFCITLAQKARPCTTLWHIIQGILVLCYYIKKFELICFRLFSDNGGSIFCLKKPSINFCLKNGAPFFWKMKRPFFWKKWEPFELRLLTKLKLGNQNRPDGDSVYSISCGMARRRKRKLSFPFWHDFLARRSVCNMKSEKTERRVPF